VARRLSAIVVTIVLLISSAQVARADRDCAHFTYQQDAQQYFESIGGSRFNNADRLDEDGDGIACERLRRRTTGSTGSTSSTGSSTFPLPAATVAEDDGLSTGWILLILAAVAGGVWYYFGEMHGPGNQRAPHPENLPYHTKTMPYESYLKTPEWFAIRQMALDRDGNKCTECGSTDRLQAHHLTYTRRGHEKLKDLQTLCRTCHEKQHKRAKY
jgi:hypothetical protein